MENFILPKRICQAPGRKFWEKVRRKGKEEEGEGGSPMPRREASVLSAFPFPWKGSGSFLSRGGKELPVCFVEGLLRVPFSTFDEGVRPFLCSLRGSNLSLCSSKGSVCFLFRGRKPIFQSASSKGFVFFLFRGREPTFFFSIGRGRFPNSKGGLSQSHYPFHIPRKNFGNRRDPTAWFPQISC